MAKRKEESNFKKAMNELLSGDIASAEEPAVKEPEVRTPHKAAERTEKVQAAAKPAPVVHKTAPVVREEALIPSDMVITGNINTKSHMKIEGSIIGDVVCEGNIHLLGSVKGNISAGNLSVYAGSLTGDAVVKETVVIGENSVVVGNISAQDIYTNARVEGQLKAAGIVELKENASIQGDISAGRISMDAGAKINGMVSISE